MKCLNVQAIEDIILVEVLDFKKPERAGEHCRGLATRAAEKIAQAVHLPAQWQAIETAPRDGTPFLCFHHDPEFSPPTSIDLIWYEPSIKTYTQDGDNEVPFAGITHWMPLPAAPVARR